MYDKYKIFKLDSKYVKCKFLILVTALRQSINKVKYNENKWKLLFAFIWVFLYNLSTTLSYLQIN